MPEGKSPLGKPRADPVSLASGKPHLVRLSLFGFGLSELGRGDIIGTDYLREGFTSLAQDIYNLNETLGITLSDLNDPEGFAKYLETGDLRFLNKDDLILIMLLPDGVRMIRDTVNQ